MTKKEKHIFPENWQNISDDEVIEHLQYLVEHYSEYKISVYREYVKIGDVLFHNFYSCEPKNLVKYYDINFQRLYTDPNSKAFILCKELEEICTDEFQKRKIMRYAKKRKIALYTFCVVLISGFVALYAFTYKRKKEIDNMVKQYEQSLPGYLEQKQAVANYRDSLQRASK
jgi:hypothetical protein